MCFVVLINNVVKSGVKSGVKWKMSRACACAFFYKVCFFALSLAHVKKKH